MTEDKKTSPRTWNAMAAGSLLLAIALGIILYWVTGELLNAFAIILLVYGVYIAATSGMKKGNEDGFGPSDSDAAVAGGIIMAGVGVTCLTWSYTGDVLPTVAVLIVIVALTGMAMAFKNRSV